MAVGIIVELEVVQVQHGHTGRVGLVLEHILKVTAVVAAGQGIVVELEVVAGHAVHQAVAVFGVDKGLAVQLLDQLHHAGLAVHLTVDRRDLKDLAAHVFQFGALGVVAQDLRRDTVLALGVLLPKVVAFAVVAEGLVTADLRSLQQAHDRKNRAELGHFLFDLFSGHILPPFVDLLCYILQQYNIVRRKMSIYLWRCRT